MNQQTYPQYWPGTNIVKSIGNAFAWQAERTHLDTTVISATPGNCTTAYNQWRASKSEVKKTPDWPEWRDAKIAKPSMRHTKWQPGGIAKNNGTIHGLSPRAEKLLAARPLHAAFVIPKPSAASKAARA